jgi:hypothetical protein
MLHQIRAFVYRSLPVRRKLKLREVEIVSADLAQTGSDAAYRCTSIPGSTDDSEER